MSEQASLIALYNFLGVLFIAVGIPLARRIVPRNGLYGFRIPKTLRSDDVWYPANRYLGRRLIRCGQILLFGSLALWPFVGVLSASTIAGFGLALSVIPVTVAVIQSFAYVNRL